MLRRLVHIVVSSFLAVSALPAAELPPGVIQKRQPNWVARTLSTYPDGQPKAILFYAPVPDSDQDAPIQLSTFHETGVPHEEMDLIVVSERHPSAKELATTVIPHGHSVTYYPGGSVAAIATYVQGQFSGPYQTYHPNGHSKALMAYERNQLNGEFREFYPNGAVAVEGRYVADQLDGPYTQYGVKGKKALTMTYAAGVIEGEALEWYESGGVKSRRFFNHGLLQDNGSTPAITLYSEDHRTTETQEFLHGQPSGAHIKFYSNGQESYRQHYRNGFRIGKETFLAENGDVIGQGEYVQNIPVGEHYRKDPVSGKVIYLAKYSQGGNLLQPITEFYVDGNKKTQYLLVDGLLSGEYLEYYPDGRVKHRYRYVKGDFDGTQEDFYPDGSPKKRAVYLQGKRNGLYEEWNKHGTRIAALNFRGGSRDGPSQEWYNNGKLKTSGTYANGLESGEKRKWDENGTLVLFANYREGEPQGPYQEWYPNGQLQRRANYADGKLRGLEEFFYENGQLQKSANYADGLPHGPLLEWFEDGSKETEGQYVKGEPDGQWKVYFPLLPGQEQPQLSRSLNYLNGHYNGEQHTYYFDGATQAILRYHQGALHGTKELWARNGEILQQTDYSNGLADGKHYEKKPSGEVVVAVYRNNRLDGPYQLFYPSNKFGERVKSLEADYVDGQYEGEVRSYDEEGNKIGSTFYRDGRKNGTAAIFSPNGATILVATFEDDLKEGPFFEYYPSGVLRREANYVHDLKEGEEKLYYEDGKLQSLNTYSDGELHGPSRSWNPDGTLTYEGNFRNGKRHGYFNKYYDDGQRKVVQVYVDDVVKPGSKKVFERNLGSS